MLLSTDLLAASPARPDTVVSGTYLIDLPADATISVRIFRARFPTTDAGPSGSRGPEDTTRGSEADHGGPQGDTERGAGPNEQGGTDKLDKNDQSESSDAQVSEAGKKLGEGKEDEESWVKRLKRMRDCPIEASWKVINRLSNDEGVGAGVGPVGSSNGSGSGLLDTPCAVVRYAKGVEGQGLGGRRELWVFGVGEWEVPSQACLEEVKPAPTPIHIRDLLSCPQHGHTYSCLSRPDPSGLSGSSGSSGSRAPASCEVVFKATKEWTALEAAVAEKLAWRAGHRVSLLSNHSLAPPFLATLRPVESGIVLRIRPVDLPSFPSETPLPLHLRPFSLRPFNVPALLVAPNPTSAQQDAKLSASFDKYFGPGWKVGRNEGRIAAVAVTGNARVISDWSVFWCPTKTDRVEGGTSAEQVARAWQQGQGVLTVWPTHLAQELVRSRPLGSVSSKAKSSSHESMDVDVAVGSETRDASRGQPQDDLMSVAAGVFDFMSTYVEPEPEAEVETHDPLDEDEEMEEVGGTQVDEMEASSKPDDGSDVDDLFSSHSSPVAAPKIDDLVDPDVPQVVLPEPIGTAVDKEQAATASQPQQQDDTHAHAGDLFSALNSPHAFTHEMDLFEQPSTTRQPTPSPNPTPRRLSLAPSSIPQREPDGYHSRPDTEGDMDFAKVTEDDFAFFDSPPGEGEDGGDVVMADMDVGKDVAGTMVEEVAEEEKEKGEGQNGTDVLASVGMASQLSTVVEDPEEGKDTLDAPEESAEPEASAADSVAPTTAEATAAAPPTPKAETGAAPSQADVPTIVIDTADDPTSEAPSKRARLAPKPKSKDIIPSEFEPLVLSTPSPLSTFAYNLPSPALTASSGRSAPAGLRVDLVERLSQKRKGYDYASAWEIESDATSAEDDDDPTGMPPTPESVEVEDESRPAQAAHHHAHQTAEDDEVQYGGSQCLGVEWCGFKDEVPASLTSSRSWNPAWVGESTGNPGPGTGGAARQQVAVQAQVKVESKGEGNDLSAFDLGLVAKTVLENRDLRRFLTLHRGGQSSDSGSLYTSSVPASTMPISGSVLGDFAGPLDPDPTASFIAAATGEPVFIEEGATGAPIQALSPVAVSVGYGPTIMRLSVAGLAYWRELGLQPAGGPKDLVAYAVAERGGEKAASEFLRDAGAVYATYMFGKHEVGESAKADKGVIPWTSANEAIRSISKEATQTTIFYLLVSPTTSIPELHRLLSHTSTSKPPFTIVHIIHLLPINTTHHLPSLTMELYSRIPREVRRIDVRGTRLLPASPLVLQHHAFTLAPRPEDATPRPQFTLSWTPRTYDVLNRARAVHSAYAVVPSCGVVVVATTDAQGEACEVMVVREEVEGGAAVGAGAGTGTGKGNGANAARVAMKRVTKVWTTAQAFADQASAEWQLTMCSLDPLSQDEVDAWRTISGARKEPFTLLMLESGDTQGDADPQLPSSASPSSSSSSAATSLVRPRAAVANVPNTMLADPAATIVDESLVATLTVFGRRMPVDLIQPQAQGGVPTTVNAANPVVNGNGAEGEKTRHRAESSVSAIGRASLSAQQAFVQPLARAAYSDASFAITLASPTATQHSSVTYHVVSHRPDPSSGSSASRGGAAGTPGSTGSGATGTTAATGGAGTGGGGAGGNGAGGNSSASLSTVPTPEALKKLGEEVYALACLGRKRYGFETSLPAHVEAVRVVRAALEGLARK